jgi:hypothetical protein
MEPSIVPVKVCRIFSVWAWVAGGMLRIIAASPKAPHRKLTDAHLPNPRLILLLLFPRMMIAPTPNRTSGPVRNGSAKFGAEQQGEKMLRDYSTKKGGHL